MSVVVVVGDIMDMDKGDVRSVECFRFAILGAGRVTVTTFNKLRRERGAHTQRLGVTDDSVPAQLLANFI